MDLSIRRSGVVLHFTSLPGPHGSGDLGEAAHRFVDWLAAAGQSVWQVLPVNPIGPGTRPTKAHRPLPAARCWWRWSRWLSAAGLT